MAKMRRTADNAETWYFEENTLAGRLKEMAYIFNYYSERPAQAQRDPRFVMTMLEQQARLLSRLAASQADEVTRLREIEKRLQALEEALKAPAPLDKPKLAPPKN